MNPKASSLFHFTKTENNLFNILSSGFWPRYCLEDIEWQGFEDYEFVAFPMVCFCDIPLGRIVEHTEFYGSYGIGLTKQWATENGLNPVIYVSPNSALTQSLVETINFAADSVENLKPEDPSPQLDACRYLVSHAKPTKGKVLDGKNHLERAFYQESEWRYIPQNNNVLTHLNRAECDDQDTIDIANYKSKKEASLKFKAKDVSFIFVPKDTDIPNVIKYMQAELGHYSNNDLLILFSRIISVETINQDI